jgi:hypothetical protein
MEQNSKHLSSTVAAMKISSQPSQVALRGQNLIRQTPNGAELSIYTDTQAEPKEIAIAVKKLSVAFPRQHLDFWTLLAERIWAKGFSITRLKEAIEYVLDNFQYKELNIADIIKFDRRVKLYSGREFVKAQMSGIHPSEFERREIDGVIFWVLKEDLINK